MSFRAQAFQISDNLLIAKLVFFHDHRCILNIWVFSQAIFYFAQFNTKAAHLHLMINAPYVFQPAVGVFNG